MNSLFKHLEFESALFNLTPDIESITALLLLPACLCLRPHAVYQQECMFYFLSV